MGVVLVGKHDKILVDSYKGGEGVEYYSAMGGRLNCLVVCGFPYVLLYRPEYESLMFYWLRRYRRDLKSKSLVGGIIPIDQVLQAKFDRMSLGVSVYKVDDGTAEGTEFFVKDGPLFSVEYAYRFVCRWVAPKVEFDSEKFIYTCNLQDWVFAKTYAKTAPHNYVVRHKWVSGGYTFDEFVFLIRVGGYNAKYYSRPMRYFNFGGFKYWTMGAPMAITIVINRVKE